MSANTVAHCTVAAILLCTCAACFTLLSPATVEHTITVPKLVVHTSPALRGQSTTTERPVVKSVSSVLDPAQERNGGTSPELRVATQDPSVVVAAFFGGLAATALALVHNFQAKSRNSASSLLKPLYLKPEYYDRRLAMAGMTGEKEHNPLRFIREKPSKKWLSKTFGAFLAVALTASLLFVPAMSADAANTAGRVGGNSFSSARSYSSSSSMGREYRAPPVTSGGTMTFAPSYSMNSFFLPMSYGVGYGYGFGFFGGGGFFNLIFLMTVLYFAFNMLQGMFGSSGGNGYDEYGESTGSVVKLQVGLLGVARGLQKDLDRIAQRADTDSPEGLHFVLQEAVLALLRNPDYCVYGFTEGMKGLDLDRAEDYFNRESLNERGKFKEETLMNYGGVRKVSSTAPGQGGPNEFIVVTLILAVEGNLVLPQVVDTASLREALQKLGGVRQDGVMALELLWTPQEESDAYTQEDIIRDYPRLNQL